VHVHEREVHTRPVSTGPVTTGPVPPRDDRPGTNPPPRV
jgi:hypothetical protein